MPSPVTHFEVLGRDAGALRAFYADVFGWTIGSPAGGYTMVTPDEQAGISGGIGAAPPGGSGHAIFYIAVDDLQAALQQVEAHGGRTVLPPQQVPDGPAFALFADPEGHVAGLATPPSR